MLITINALMDKLRPWALKAGRMATRPLLQFYYVPQINAKVEDTLNEWFGVEYKLVEG